MIVDLLLTTISPFGSEPFTPEHTVAAGFPARARATVDSAGGTICFVPLRVSDGEQERRVAGPPTCRQGKHVFEHILVMEEMLGRYLLPNE